MMRIKEVASLVGISIRTLHHYDKIGLLKPEITTEGGYRIYSDSDLEVLQQILFFRELGFPLMKIKEIIGSPNYNRQEALEIQRKMLIDKRKQLDKVILTIEKTIKHTKGEIYMSNKEKFEGFDFRSNPYEKEARERYGDEAVDKSKAKISKMNEKELRAFTDASSEVYTKLASIRHTDPSSKEAQEAIGEWYRLLNTIGTYSLDAFTGLGQMYVDDERFTQNIDKFGEGLAVFMRDAMAVYSDARRK